jgi:ribonuclease J
MPPERVVLISTGSQGEPLSALARMANREHQQVRVEPDDTVILASSMVPGNETAVYRVINGLAREGAAVVHKEVAMVHVSGHAPAGELLYLLNATKPRNVLPVHGEWRHLRAHGKLAELTGVPNDRVVLADDGVVVDLVDGIASVTGKVDCGYVYVDGLAVGDVGEESLKDRRILGDEGFIAITVVVDSVTGKVLGSPVISGRGFSDDPVAFEPVLALITAELERVTGEGATEPHRLAQAVRRVVGRWVSDRYRRRPMIVPTVIEV